MSLTTKKARALLTARGESVSDAPTLTHHERGVLNYHLEQLGLTRSQIAAALSYSGAVPDVVQSLIDGSPAPDAEPVEVVDEPEGDAVPDLAVESDPVSDAPVDPVADDPDTEDPPAEPTED